MERKTGSLLNPLGDANVRKKEINNLIIYIVHIKKSSCKQKIRKCLIKAAYRQNSKRC
jgi:hypothetical protein